MLLIHFNNKNIKTFISKTLLQRRTVLTKKVVRGGIETGSNLFATQHSSAGETMSKSSNLGKEMWLNMTSKFLFSIYLL